MGMSSGLRDLMQAVYDEHGVLTPQLVVDTARPKNHPLHNRFEWNNARAGEAWRRQQAHEMIRACRVRYREADETDAGADVRAWHAVRTPTDNSYVYEPAEKVAGDELLSAMVLRDMEREWKQLHRRYGQFREFVELVQGDIGEAAA